MHDLPPFGHRVVGIRKDGRRLIVFRRAMPRGGWAWGQHYRPRNLAPEVIVKWKPWNNV